MALWEIYPPEAVGLLTNQLRKNGKWLRLFVDTMLKNNICVHRTPTKIYGIQLRHRYKL